MIVVSGTGRSGTSMWMQALGRGGLPVLGDAFPLQWTRTFADANTKGFYESSLWNGINSTTNPDPISGAFLGAEETRHVVTKIFFPGLPRSHREYLHRVIVSMRDWRAFEQSRLRADVIYGRDPEQFTPAHRVWRWWQEVVVGVTDVVHRGYPCRFVDYDALLADPEQHMLPVLKWLDVEVDTDAALAAVDVKMRTQTPTETPDVPKVWVEALDEVQARLKGGVLDAAFVGRLRALNGEVFAAKPHYLRDLWGRKEG